LPIIIKTREVHRNMRNVLIYGAGEAGREVLREIKAHPEEGIKVLGFIDDDDEKKNRIYEGVRVLGGRGILRDAISTLKVSEIIIAMPSIEKECLRDIVRVCKAERIKLLIVPSTMDIIEGSVRFDQIKNLDLADLLDREEVKVNTEEIREYISGKRVLVTGASGSIGSVLVKKIIDYNPEAIIALDFNESGIFGLYREIEKKRKNTKVVFSVTDIKDYRILKEVFINQKPQIVFHAAAYKHVPIMENHIKIAFINNVLGTYNLLRLSLENKVQRFVGISTDKAVNPVSVMGKTKRICELLISAYAKLGLSARSVRFGNVLGSNGSVLNIFKEQIQRGENLTVTSPEMERFFMTIDEATELCLQAGCGKGNGDIFILQMGDPIRIVDLAYNVIILSGLTPGVDVKIDYTGIRDGEKLKEELFHKTADVIKSEYNGIYLERINVQEDYILRFIKRLQKEVYILSDIEVLREMEEIIKIHSGAFLETTV